MSTTLENPTESIVRITDSAAQELRAKLAAEPGAAKGLRVFVESGGCSGMQYGMTFDEARPGDAITEFAGVRVLVDEISANHLRGSVVDFSDALTGGGFKITNPNARSSCGCGKSFET